MRLFAALGLSVTLASSACHAETLADAEKKGDLEWLDQNGSPEALAAIGRIADTNTMAVDFLTARATSDVNAYIAAWTATMRGATWGPTLLRAGLADPARADVAASIMARKDVHLAAFVPDLETSLMRTAASARNGAVASVLASAGAPGAQAIQRRLEDVATRGAMCRGIGSPDASDEARHVLMAVAPSSRDNDSCVQAVLRLAVGGDTALEWLATKGEPGLLSAAGKSEEFPCARIKKLWASTLANRPLASTEGLTVPLSSAISRCAPELDSVLADALAHAPPTHGLVVAAIDPFGNEMADLKATCAALRPLVYGRESEIVRERAGEATSRGCR